MSRSDQIAWDNISDQAKFKIMFAYKDRPLKPTNPVGNRLNAQVHDSLPVDDASPNEGDTFLDAHQEPSDEADTTILVQAAAQKAPIAPSDLRRVLSSKKGKKSVKPTLHIETSVHELVYHVSNHRGFFDAQISLVDRGANGGLAGSNMRVLANTDRLVDISGIDNHQMTGLKIVTAGGVVPTQRGDVIDIFHQYAHVPQGRSIHSSVQLESFGIKVDDRPKVLKAGLQTNSGRLCIAFRFQEWFTLSPDSSLHRH